MQLHYLRYLLCITLCLLLWTNARNLLAQDVPLTFDSAFLVGNTWQEYLPDAYALDDSTMLMAGLNTNMRDLTVNFLLRKMDVNGAAISETEILNFNNPDGFTYAHYTFYAGSTIDADHVYILTGIGTEYCDTPDGMPSAYHLIKVRLSDHLVEKDTIMCYSGHMRFSGISTSATEDSLYLYGRLRNPGQSPVILLTVMTKDFSVAVDYPLRTIDTRMLPLGIPGDSRAVAGSRYGYSSFAPNLQDIWTGRIDNDTIIERSRMEYFEQHVLYKPFVFGDDEIGLLGIGMSDFETSAYLLRNDTLEWNFHAASFREFSDFIRVGNRYCIVQSSYIESDDRLDRVVLHFLDFDGFAYGREEFITPWISYTHGGLRVGDFYFVFVYISDFDEWLAVVGGDIPLEEAIYEYTHVLKFRVHE